MSDDPFELAIEKVAPVPAEKTFFGQPPALAYLAFTEAWERFSFYGLNSLLVLYMSQWLLTPGHMQHIIGMHGLRAGLEQMFGRLTTLGLASQIKGLYSGFVYFTPVLGGLIADRFTGRRAAVVAGALLMSAGHIAMAFDASFLFALTLLIVGCGLLKGNISTQVGELYREDDGEGRTRGFAIFSMAINFGAVGGPLLCGLLAQIWGWHAGFGLAGVLMLLALATYLAGYRHLPKPSAAPKAAKAERVGGRNETTVVLGLFAIMALSVFQSVIYYQNTSIGLVWVDSHVDLNFLGFHVPVGWFGSIDPLTSILCAPLLFVLWRWQHDRKHEPDEIGKIATGAFIATGANLIQALASLSGGRVSVLAPVAYDVLLGVGFLYYWPTMLALVSRAAPARLKATLVGSVFLSLFAANLLIGWIGALYETMGPTAFWGMQVAIGIVGGVMILLLRPTLNRLVLREQAVA